MRQHATEEYLSALKMGQREAKELTAAGKSPYPAVLDDILPDGARDSYQEIGLVEIPANAIIGTRSAGRIHAFSASFYPLLEETTEFGIKWINLCMAHLSEEGIRDPILCYEYLGRFYVEEGNKRVSVLRSFGAPRIPGIVRRILPRPSEEPHIKAYCEFIDFYKDSKIYDVQFRQPGSYAKLLAALDKDPGVEWTVAERRAVSSALHYFREAFYALGGKSLTMRAEEALLIWLQVYPFRQLSEMTAPELKKSLQGLWEDVLLADRQMPTQVKTVPAAENKGNIITRLISAAPEHLNVAFIHRQDLSAKWVQGHEDGRAHLEKALAGQVSTKSYFNAYNSEQAEILLDKAVAEGAQVVFTTSPQLSRPTTRAAVKYPKVRFLNNSVDTPISRIRTYYGRIYEGKFITGAIAGAMAENDRIGYMGDYPIFGVPAAINAFALGAQLTNPRATVELRWSCLPGNPVNDFIRDGIRVISNRETPGQDPKYLSFGEFGTYHVGEDGTLTTLGSPCWVWGKFYERVIRSILDGTWERGKDAKQALSYWWGMDSGVIDVELADNLPEGALAMAQLLRQGVQNGTIDPFMRRIVAQDGTLKNDGTHRFTPDELLKMDWLCSNVIGSIPEFEDVLPMSQGMVRMLGIHRDRIPPEKEADAL